ncbi:MAG TPA: hypothetical protein VGW38_25450 [Chloroflexota bacterium]|nr:hypothetical protein [Chloroflexota bacterium]
MQLPEDAQAAPGGHADTQALELERLRAEVSGLGRLVEEISSDRDHWREHAHRSQVMAETAQRLAERAQTLALPSGGDESGVRSHHHHTSAGTEAAQRPWARPWGAVRRLVRGG